MELPVSLQCIELLRAAALGLGLGIYYDVLRCIRGRSRVLTHLLDLLFGLTLLLSLLLFALYAGRGDFRLFAFVGILCGASLYFLLLSPHVCRLLRAVFRAILAPFRLLRRFLRFFSKKIKIFAKKLFSRRKKWYRIVCVKKSALSHGGEHKYAQGGSTHALSQDKIIDQAFDSGAVGVRHVHARLAPKADRHDQRRNQPV